MCGATGVSVKLLVLGIYGHNRSRDASFVQLYWFLSHVLFGEMLLDCLCVAHKQVCLCRLRAAHKEIIGPHNGIIGPQHTGG